LFSYIQPATECPYELDGDNDPGELKALHENYERECREYHERIAEWNRLQRRRLRAGKPVQTAGEYLVFLGLSKKPAKRALGAIKSAVRRITARV